ncbi:hypothetical protein DH2020_008480 [Rehmannia glutinosa]|uniref:Chalcone-flavonone isomerase family protein n=1 Tax=Rehmannia glutinosa TaxID=99300 RepID=A0ABR0X3G9_REHGL
MAPTLAISTLVPHSSLSKSKPSVVNPRICFLANSPNKPLSLLNYSNQFIANLSAFPSHRVCIKRNGGHHNLLSPKAASSSSGYREKVFAIIGVKVYAAGLYTNPSIFIKLDAWKGHSSAELQKDSSIFNAIFQAPVEKSLLIILVRDVDGKTFWDALDEAISPRITSPTPVDESALSTFRSIFQGRPLKKGTSIFLTWLDTAKMLVCVSPDGAPSSVDATIESSNVTSALFDVFLGGNPVSPTLKASASNGLAAALK